MRPNAGIDGNKINICGEMIQMKENQSASRPLPVCVPTLRCSCRHLADKEKWPSQEIKEQIRSAAIHTHAHKSHIPGRRPRQPSIHRSNTKPRRRQTQTGAQASSGLQHILMRTQVRGQTQTQVNIWTE